MSITLGQLNTGLGTLSNLVAALQGAVASKFTNLPDDAVVLEDGLELASFVWPPAAAIAEAVELLVELEPLIVASGVTVSPAPDPEVDSNDPATPHTGRNG